MIIKEGRAVFEGVAIGKLSVFNDGLTVFSHLILFIETLALCLIFLFNRR